MMLRTDSNYLLLYADVIRTWKINECVSPARSVVIFQVNPIILLLFDRRPENETRTCVVYEWGCFLVVARKNQFDRGGNIVQSRANEWVCKQQSGYLPVEKAVFNLFNLHSRKCFNKCQYASSSVGNVWSSNPQNAVRYILYTHEYTYYYTKKVSKRISFKFENTFSFSRRRLLRTTAAKCLAFSKHVEIRVFFFNEKRFVKKKKLLPPCVFVNNWFIYLGLLLFEL